jgi:putative ABC transport system permease protein
MSLISRFVNGFRRRDLNDEIDEELRFHVEARIAANIGEGMTADDARREALRGFGGVAAAREDTRDANLVASVDALKQDVTIAARGLRRHPGFALVAVATLALGIGATTTIFTVIERLLLRPLPFDQADRIYSLSNSPKNRPFWLMPGLADLDYLALQEGSLPFSAVATFGATSATLTGAGDATRLTGATVTPSFFQVLGVHPALGRALAQEDAAPNALPVVLLSDGLWRDRFGGDPGCLNRVIQLDGTAYTIIGVLPPGFSYPERTAFWTPLAVRTQPGMSFSRPAIARLKTDTTPASARAAFEAFVANRSTAGDSLVARFVPLQQAVVGDVGSMLLLIASAVGCLLLIACANVANLLLVRSVSRRQEIATRRALGASRGRIVRQLLTESSLLATLGGVAGVGLAILGIPALLSLIPDGRLPRADEVRVDGPVLAFTVVISLVTGLAVGLAPALLSTRKRLAGAIKEGPAAASPASHRLRHVLIVAEIGIALMLLIGAALLGQSFLKLQGIDTGFHPKAVMTMSVRLPDARYGTASQAIEFHGRVLSSLSATPGVASAALVNWLPFGRLSMTGDITAQGREVPRGFLPVKAAVSADYFKVMGVRLQTGRMFGPQDREGAAQVAIVSETVARTAWPGEPALGRLVSTETNPEPKDWLTVVGVVDDVKQGELRARRAPAIYLPYSQVNRLGWLNSVTYVALAVSTDPASLAPSMRGVMRGIDPDQAPESLLTMSDRVGTTIAEPRFQARLIGVFSLAAVVLAGVGIYSVLAAAVFERRREIGIRMALGADRGRVVGMMLRRALILALIGVGVGLAGAYGAAGALTKFLWQTTPTDASTFAWASAALLAIAILAGVLPARRASRVDPVTALRAD